MSFFEYVSVFISIIVALGITQLLLGIAKLIEKPSDQRIYWVHMVWAAGLFLVLLLFWWAEFRLVTVEEWTFYSYGILALYATVLFLVSAVLFPSGSYDGIDFEERFFARRKWFFGLNLTWLAIDQLDTLLKGFDHYRNLGLDFLFTVALAASLFSAGLISQNRKLHGAIAVIAFLLLVRWIISNFSTVAS
jgi:hypothetical protein